MIERLRQWYRGRVLVRLRQKASADGEIFFDKYERDGAYHWAFYYGGKTPHYKELVDTVVGWVPAETNVLDIGCGDGLLAHRLAEVKGCFVTGIDIHPLAVSLAREKNGPRNEFVVGSAYNCGQTGRYDAAVAIEVFEHLARPERMVANAMRILKPGGVFVTSTPLSRPGRAISRYHAREFTETDFRGIVSALFDVADSRRIEDGGTTLVLRCIRDSGAKGRVA